MSGALFRTEALENATFKHLGEPRLDSTTGVLSLALIALTALIITGWTIGSFNYSRKHAVQGSFDEVNASTIVSPEFAHLTDLAVSEGQYVVRGQYLGRLATLNSDGSQALMIRELDQQLRHWQTIEALSAKSYAQKKIHYEKNVVHLRALFQLARQDIRLQQSKVLHLGKQLQLTEKLQRKGYLSNLDWLSFRTSLISERQRLNEQKKLLVQLQRQWDELTQASLILEHEHKKQIAEIAVHFSDIRRQQTEEIRAHNRHLIAPTDGLITRLEVRDGSTLRPGQPIMYISNHQGSLTGTLKIPSHVAGHVRVGSQVELEIDAFPSESYGRIMATIVNLSDHTIVDSSDGASYRARLSIQPNQAVERYLPGMRFKTHITTESHTIIAWIMKPLSRMLDSLG